MPYAPKEDDTTDAAEDQDHEEDQQPDDHSYCVNKMGDICDGHLREDSGDEFEEEGKSRSFFTISNMALGIGRTVWMSTFLSSSLTSTTTSPTRKQCRQRARSSSTTLQQAPRKLSNRILNKRPPLSTSILASASNLKRMILKIALVTMSSSKMSHV